MKELTLEQNLWKVNMEGEKVFKLPVSLPKHEEVWMESLQM
jgi:hypothetical protein